MMSDRTIVVIGGGIAGTSCIESLITEYNRGESQFNSLILVSEGQLLKKAVNYELSGRSIDSFDVREELASETFDSISLPEGLSLKCFIGHVSEIDVGSKKVHLTDHSDQSRVLNYDLLCLCSGSRPKELLPPNRLSDRCLADRMVIIRDTMTVSELEDKLKGCRHLVIIGNGGISLELVSKIKNCNKTWIVKDEWIGPKYLDSEASKFMLDSSQTENEQPRVSSTKFSSTRPAGSCREPSGPSLGPHWSETFNLIGQIADPKLEIITQDELVDVIYDGARRQFSLTVITKAKRTVECDLIAVAIGVQPCWPSLVGGDLDKSTHDDGILIDDQMRTSLEQVYAAGDVVSCDRWPKQELWFQMRLWTQARQMGFYAGQCMASHLSNQDPSIYNNFDCFTHCTRFFGRKLILLGRYNGQHLSDDEVESCEIIVRVVEKKHYVKLLLKNGKIIGAVMIGETGLEETIENLIHDQIDISPFKDRLLDGTVDIEDYFD